VPQTNFMCGMQELVQDLIEQIIAVEQCFMLKEISTKYLELIGKILEELRINQTKI
jgi:hypothetical protein